MAELQYQAEYAKSGQASCKGCKQKIDQGTLRIAIIVESTFVKWHHEECFFKIQRPTVATDIGHLNKLKHADQQRITRQIENYTGIVTPETKVKEEDKGKKRAANGDGGSDSSAVKDNFRVEYSKSSLTSCCRCDIKICKDEVRICKVILNTKMGATYRGRPLWHHVKCFAEEREDLQFFAGGESLLGFNTLSKEHKDLVKNEIKPFKSDEVPVKKKKSEPKDEAELKEKNEKKKKMKEQKKLYHGHRNVLSVLERTVLEELLEDNSQEIPGGCDELLDRVADMMAFGALKPCPECKQGQLVLETFGYKCTGNITEWTKCSYVTQNPQRVAMIVPKAYKNWLIFKNIELETDVRLFKATPTLSTSKKKNIPIPPLKNLQFFVFGKLKDKEKTKKRILKMGGLIVSRLLDTVVAVVSTKQDVERMPKQMYEIKEKDCVVVEASFLDLIDPKKGTVAYSLQLIKENNIAEWESKPATREMGTVANSLQLIKKENNIEEWGSDPAIYCKKEKETIDNSLQLIKDNSIDEWGSDQAIYCKKENKTIDNSLQLIKDRREVEVKIEVDIDEWGSDPAIYCKKEKETIDNSLQLIKDNNIDEWGSDPAIYCKKEKETIDNSLQLIKDRREVEVKIEVDIDEWGSDPAIYCKKEKETIDNSLQLIKENNDEWGSDPAFYCKKEKETIDYSLQLIKDNNIDEWGSDPATKVQQEVQDENSIPKSDSMSVSGKWTLERLRIKGVDPDSGLKDVAHVYDDFYDDGNIREVKFQPGDVTHKVFHKLQVLESNDKEKYWLFRAWGCIGTNIGRHKLYEFSDAEEATYRFDHYYDY